MTLEEENEQLREEVAELEDTIIDLKKKLNELGADTQRLLRERRAYDPFDYGRIEDLYKPIPEIKKVKKQNGGF